jgi:prophage tail gpP-like protein
MDKLTVHSNGNIWQDWTQFSLSRALKACTGEIRLSMTRPWNGVQPINIDDGEPITVFVGNELIATGYVSEFRPGYDAKTIRYELICHDKTIDLVECAVVHASGQWNNITLDTLAREICQPFNIDVAVEADIGTAFSTIRLEPGETAFELLERLSRQRGVLLTTNALGQLVLTTSSAERLNSRLQLGQNIRAAQGRFSIRERFSQIIVKGDGGSQSQTDISETGGQSVTQTDPDVPRYRPHILLTEELFTIEGAERRGKWQIADNLAKSAYTQITVSGWRYGDPENGSLWPLNRRIQVTDPIQNIEAELLIVSRTFTEDETGRQTVLGLSPPQAMQIETNTNETNTTGTIIKGWQG